MNTADIRKLADAHGFSVIWVVGHESFFSKAFSIKVVKTRDDAVFSELVDALEKARPITVSLTTMLVR